MAGTVLPGLAAQADPVTYFHNDLAGSPAVATNAPGLGGFIITGSVPKTVIITGKGPSLAQFGVPGVLANPSLALYSGPTPIAGNDNWGNAPNVAQIQATGKAPTNALESAILVMLTPGAYTAILSGVGGTGGVGLIEVYEVDAPQSPLWQMSTRGLVLTGDYVMIGGFVISGDSPKTVLLKARGPSLAALGITNALSNPQVRLYSGMTLIASNDDWGSAPNAAEIQAIGGAPSNPLESAILVTLSPGGYTAIVSGTGGVTGVGIVELVTP